MISDPVVIAGIIVLVLFGIYTLSNMPQKGLKLFFMIFPSVLLCYFVPAILVNTGFMTDGGGVLYSFAKTYLLPVSLILFCLNLDFKGLMKLGPKALLMFFLGTTTVIIGGAVSLFLVSRIAPSLLSQPEGLEVWRGLATVAGSWIGGGANQNAMKEIYQTPDSLFSVAVAADVLVANIWMAVLLFLAGNSKRVDKAFKADSSAVEELRSKMHAYAESVRKPLTYQNLLAIMLIGFGGLALATLLSSFLAPTTANAIKSLGHTAQMYLESFGSSFFWIILLCTIIGIALSFTKYRALEGSGASIMASFMIYILVATIGMEINFSTIAEKWHIYKYFFLVTLLWITIHGVIMLLAAKIFRVPVFFMAVGSQANIGGAASAPIVASAFDGALAPVGVILAVLGYAVGTVGAIVAAVLMAAVSA